ncbi:MAG: hypothetical protein HUJ25_08350 [Crocinitomicaceae bacterium]|nr:hypothetical protein [Crocinitomicaceae bacterium]
MKATATITLLIFSVISFSQTDFSGTWFLPDDDHNTPFGLEFHADGRFTQFEVDPESNNVYERIEGSYYFEEGSNLLVTITWYGTEAVTSKYEYSFNNGNLILKQTYPSTFALTLVRELDIAEL